MIPLLCALSIVEYQFLFVTAVYEDPCDRDGIGVAVPSSVCGEEVTLAVDYLEQIAGDVAGAAVVGDLKRIEPNSTAVGFSQSPHGLHDSRVVTVTVKRIRTPSCSKRNAMLGCGACSRVERPPLQARMDPSAPGGSTGPR